MKNPARPVIASLTHMVELDKLGSLSIVPELVLKVYYELIYTILLQVKMICVPD